MKPNIYVLYVKEKQKEIYCLLVYEFNPEGIPMVVAQIGQDIRLMRYDSISLMNGVDSFKTAYEFELALFYKANKDNYRIIFNGRSDVLEQYLLQIHSN